MMFLIRIATAIAVALASHGAYAAGFDGNRQTVHYRFITADGVKFFLREAGDPAKPTIVLLHGNPSSSHMFRDLMPLLATDFHVIAPDYPAHGFSDVPSPAAFAYTFDHLSTCIESIVEQLGVKSYSLYMMDFGVPVGFRIAVRHPERIESLVVQNGIIHGPKQEDADDWLKPFFDRRDPAAEKRLRNSYTTAQITRKYYELGAQRLERISPDAWIADQYVLDQPGVRDARVELMYDYRNNVTAWPSWQAYLREKQPPTLIVWGRQDPIFSVDQALAYLDELPNAELHLLDGGHFMLEEHAALVAGLIREFHRRNVH